jgi:hypothetical protein
MMLSVLAALRDKINYQNADYLPFKPLIKLKGVAGKVSQEMIFYQTKKASQIQFTLF